MCEKRYEQQRKDLVYLPKNGYDRLKQVDRDQMEDYCAQYKDFLDAAKTEREAVSETIRLAEQAGYLPWTPGLPVQAGARYYYNNRNKAILLARIGQKPLEAGARITAAHIDSPRLDLKPNPLYEDAELALFKTHYYGGIKKYQWPTVPLALHGVIAKKDGTAISVCIGEDDQDPVFCISDLLIHLAGDQMKKTLASGITGESLNVIVGSVPLHDDDGADRVKFAILMLLHERYGITEEDFLSAELSLVPAMRARDVGLDRSLIGAYGHDDRVCAFAALRPLLEEGTADYSSVCVLADKEEIGSEGVSGMQSYCFETFLHELCQGQSADFRRCFQNSMCLSADVTNAFDPTFAEVHDKRNNARINYGIALCKYTGARGKSGASDASAELVAKVRGMLDEQDVMWQMGELGKVDQGGGGTVAVYMANRNIDTLDAGVPVLSMHAPFEIVGKLDCYMSYKAMKVFYEAK